MHGCLVCNYLPNYWLLTWNGSKSNSLSVWRPLAFWLMQVVKSVVAGIIIFTSPPAQPSVGKHGVEKTAGRREGRSHKDHVMRHKAQAQGEG